MSMAYGQQGGYGQQAGDMSGAYGQGGRKLVNSKLLDGFILTLMKQQIGFTWHFQFYSGGYDQSAQPGGVAGSGYGQSGGAVPDPYSQSGGYGAQQTSGGYGQVIKLLLEMNCLY